MTLAALCGLTLHPAPIDAAHAVENSSAGEFWREPRVGANLFNRQESAARIHAAAELGVDFVRLAPDKWRGAGRDFLIGDADGYTGIPPSDLSELARVLDAASTSGVRVVLTMLSLPGARWRQANGGSDDGRLWNAPAFQHQAVAFWTDLVKAVAGHPAIVGYDLLNEPHPARTLAGLEVGDPAYGHWWEQARGTPADLNQFYRRAVAAIRAVDPRTPILIESAGYAAVGALDLLEPVDDPAVLYSFHFYEPWTYTARRVNKGRYTYPDRMPAGSATHTERWERTRIAERLAPAVRWASRHGLPPGRLVLGELGCSRQVQGVTEYLADVIDAADANGWHWAFYAFREDTWSDMDYELGPAPVPWSVLEPIQAGTRSRAPFRENPIFQMLVSKIGAN